MKRHLERLYGLGHLHFNVWSSKERNEKLNYMHFNPFKRGLAAYPKDWLWSSYAFYSAGKLNLCAPNPEWIHRPTLQPRKGRAPTRSVNSVGN